MKISQKRTTRFFFYKKECSYRAVGEPWGAMERKNHGTRQGLWNKFVPLPLGRASAWPQNLNV